MSNSRDIDDEIKELLEQTKAKDAEIRKEAIKGIKYIGDAIPNSYLETVVERLLELMRDEKLEVRAWASKALLENVWRALSKPKRINIIDHLLELTHEDDEKLRGEAVISIGFLKNTATVPEARLNNTVDRMLELTDDESENVREEVAKNLLFLFEDLPKSYEDKVGNSVIQLTHDKDLKVQVTVIGFLAVYSKYMPESLREAVADRLIELTENEDWHLRGVATHGLGALGEVLPENKRQNTVERLIPRLNDENERIRSQAPISLSAIWKLLPTSQREAILNNLTEHKYVDSRQIIELARKIFED